MLHNSCGDNYGHNYTFICTFNCARSEFSVTVGGQGDILHSKRRKVSLYKTSFNIIHTVGVFFLFSTPKETSSGDVGVRVQDSGVLEWCTGGFWCDLEKVLTLGRLRGNEAESGSTHDNSTGLHGGIGGRGRESHGS